MTGTWLRAGSWLQCGAEDDCRIEAGEPYLLITGENWTKARCQKHAGRPVPPDWDKDRQPVKPSGFVGLKTLVTRFDPKRAAAGRDDD